MNFKKRKKENNLNNLRVIKTARDEKSINAAAKQGYFPLVKKVEKSNEIKSKYAVFQNKKTGEIIVSGDYRCLYRRICKSDYAIISTEELDQKEDCEYKTVIDFTFYYPYHFPSPYAAYLIPEDIKIGEKVFLEDLIEDYVGKRWNQGDTYRLESCKAIWNGKDFDILYDPKTNCNTIIG